MPVELDSPPTEHILLEEERQINRSIGTAKTSISVKKWASDGDMQEALRQLDEFERDERGRLENERGRLESVRRMEAANRAARNYTPGEGAQSHTGPTFRLVIDDYGSDESPDQTAYSVPSATSGEPSPSERTDPSIATQKSQDSAQ